MQTWYIHADLDAFFSSVEQLDHPEYRGKPVIVGGLPGDPRSVVSTASYEARKYGVHSAMPTSQAYRLCPNGIYIHGNMARYAELSFKIMEIFSRFSPEVTQMSIDEAFINMTGTELLFGPPWETALKIKNTVKEETGLTVSIGLASSKYFAKLSSEVNKPDGFYFMKPGTEQDFMLSRPIEKIWGIGQKTTDRIKKTGIKNTKELFARSKDSLVFMFGENTGSFLYNIIRGNSEGTFSSKPKIHSISNERTFPVDVTDYYANETAILELAHTVMFRLLREKGSSRTVAIKIRYEDFTTVSIRQTFDRPILTLDSFYEKCRELFHQKYEYGRGVRLLGVGFDNVEFGQTEYQRDLFDNTDEKKQAVEKTIMKLEEKFPGISLQKARTLKSSGKLKAILFLPLIFSFGIRNRLFARDNYIPTMLPAESPDTLFNFNTGSSIVEFEAGGYWEAGFTGNIILPFGNIPSVSLPVFKQDVDFFANLIIDKKWYLETVFADSFKKNTMAMGYNGQGLIKSVRLSNRGITFPDDYSSKTFGYGISGGKNQAPGINVSLDASIWNADFTFRYDLVTSKSAVFYGYNEVSDTFTDAGDYVNGRFFHLPEKLLSEIAYIYVENNSGNYTDTKHHKFTKLSEDLFHTVKTKNALILTREAFSQENNGILPRVFIEFKNPVLTESLIATLGNCSNDETFLGKLQSWFNNTSVEINLEDYFFPFISDINGTPVFVIQSPEGFSPFINASVYDTGDASESDLTLISTLTSEKIDIYTVTELDPSFLNQSEDFFDDKRLFVSVTRNSPVKKSGPWDYFPLADKNPFIYLITQSETDIKIQKRTYKPVPCFQIPKDIAEGSIRVYINGVPDNTALYDSKTGIVTTGNVSETDRITITWDEENTDFSKGNIVAGAGFSLFPVKELKTDAAFTLSWPILQKNLYAYSSDFSNTGKGFAAFSSGITYSKNDFTILDQSSISYENENTSDNLLVWEPVHDSPKTYYLDSTSGNESTVVPYISELNLKESDRGQIKSLTGEKDFEISGFAIPFCFDFTSIETPEQTPWISGNIELQKGAYLINGTSFSFALKDSSSEYSNLDAFDIFLQLGINAKDEKKVSDERRIPHWKISSETPDVEIISHEGSDWKEVIIHLKESDRARFTENHDARLVIVKKTGLTAADKGKILFGPYETKPETEKIIHSPELRTEISSSDDISTPSYSVLKKTDGYAAQIKWEKTGTSENESFIMSSHFFNSDISNYEKINIPFAIESETEATKSKLVFTLDRNEIDAETDGTIFMRLEISLLNGNLVSEVKNWHTLSVSVKDRKVFLDGFELPQDAYSLFLNTEVKPSRYKIKMDNISAKKGKLYLDSVWFSENKGHLIFQNRFFVKYENPDFALKIKDYPIIAEPEVSLESYQKSKISDTNEKDSVVTGHVTGSINITKIKLKADASFSSKEKNIFTGGGHRIATIEPLFKFISFNEDFRLSNIENSHEKSDELIIDFSPLQIPLKITYEAAEKESIWKNRQKINTSLKFSLLPKNFRTNIFAAASLTREDENTNTDDINYFTGYKQITEKQFSSGSENDLKRNVSLEMSIDGKLPFASLNPKISGKFESEFLSPLNTAQNRGTISFAIPLKISQNYISLQWSKNYDSVSSPLSNKGYVSGFEEIGNSLQNNSWFFTTIPFYDLWDWNLSSRIIPSKNSFNGGSRFAYTTEYSLTWKREPSNALFDFFLPNSSNLVFQRNITSNDFLQDYYQAKFILNNTSINIFGAKSSLSWFSWYETDEFDSSLSLSMRLPSSNNQNYLWTMDYFGQLLCFVSTDTSLRCAAFFAIDTNKDFMGKINGIWTYILSPAYKSKKTGKQTVVKIKNQETFNIEAGKKELMVYQEFQAGHKSEFLISRFISVSANILTIFRNESTGNQFLKMEYTLSGKMTF